MYPIKAYETELGLSRSSFYRWYRQYVDEGSEGSEPTSRAPRRFWNKLPEPVKAQCLEVALQYPEKSPRELAWHITDKHRYFISASSVYRLLQQYDLITSPAYILMQAGDKFRNLSKRVNELWQTDFSYCRIVAWGWYYLSTVLDDYSGYIIAWKLSTNMAAADVQKTLELAIETTGVNEIKVKHRPRLLSDNGPCYLSPELKEYLRKHQMQHTHGAPYQPMTQGKIDMFFGRYHEIMDRRALIKVET